MKIDIKAKDVYKDKEFLESLQDLTKEIKNLRKKEKLDPPQQRGKVYQDGTYNTSYVAEKYFGTNATTFNKILIKEGMARAGGVLLENDNYQMIKIQEQPKWTQKGLIHILQEFERRKINVKH